jgi:hypothetical protein
MARMSASPAFLAEHPLRTWLAAGVAATAALGRFEWLERLALGEEPAYAPARVAERLLGHRRYGPVLRWTYGPALGIAFGALRSRFGVPALAFGALVATAEAVGMPRVGATPKLRGRELVALFAHAAAFAVAAEAALRQAARSASRSAATV